MIGALGIALLGMSLLPTPTQADTKQSHSANMAFQVALCKAGGGVAVIIDAPNVSHVTCHGGVYDGMKCLNTGDGQVFCSNAHPHPVPLDLGDHVWQPTDVMPVLESGSPEQMTEMLTEIETAQGIAPGSSLSAVNLDDHRQDQDAGKVTGKHKNKNKKGKKGGKGRRH